MDIEYKLKTRTDNWNQHTVNMECSYTEFVTLCEMIGGNVPDSDLEKEILSEFEVAQDAFKGAYNGNAEHEC